METSLKYLIFHRRGAEIAEIPQRYLKAFLRVFSASSASPRLIHQ
jgi:hypothetical protein